ncbi:S8 family peptidase [Niallia oryzisoli]|uniref:S8 family peptidase n=1 Tax=Niallia oryzisoli TaxID=1737571 RepID=A0ABZ2CB89_9BACI
MFGYSMVQMVRAHADKLERTLRDLILNMYRPFKWTPCFLHKFFEGTIKRGKKISVIVEFQDGCYEEGCNVVEGIMDSHMRNKIRHYFPRISSCSVDITPSGLEDVLNSCQHIKKVYLNSEVKALLNVAVPAAGAKGINRGGRELTGKGVKIAIIDTGIHPHQDLSNRITDFKDFVNNRTAAYDDNGHGTHCAGDAASASATYAGPAPNATLVGVKVLDKMGSGSLETVMQGVDWCIQYNIDHPLDRIDIISMSLGSTAQNYGSEDADPMVKIVEKAWESGIVVCVAAGNEGPNAGTIASPGISDKVITVGALDDRDSVERTDDDVASFSSRGPTRYGLTKPDILAPGVNIISLRAPNSYLDKLQKSARVDNDYFMLSGTSMATPICAGIVALILERNSSLSPDQVKEALMENADLWKGKDPNVYGAGYINAERSVPI